MLLNVDAFLALDLVLLPVNHVGSPSKFRFMVGLLCEFVGLQHLF